MAKTKTVLVLKEPEGQGPKPRKQHYYISRISASAVTEINPQILYINAHKMAYIQVKIHKTNNTGDHF